MTPPPSATQRVNRRPLWLGALCVGGLIALVHEPTVGDGDLRALLRELGPLVEAETGATLPADLRVDAISRHAALRYLERRWLETQPGEADGGSVTFEGGGFPAVYDHLERAVLVSPPALRLWHRFLQDPEVPLMDLLRLTMIHELVHAADHAQHTALVEGFNATRSGDQGALLASRALVEGHAEHVTERVASRLGLSHAVESMQRIRSSLGESGFRYLQGAAFIDAVAAAGGREAVRRALADPPREVALILHPEWYLDPASRPAPRADVRAALERLADGEPRLVEPTVEEGWLSLIGESVFDREGGASGVLGTELLEVLELRAVFDGEGDGRRLAGRALVFPSAELALREITERTERWRIRMALSLDGSIEVPRGTGDLQGRVAWRPLSGAGWEGGALEEHWESQHGGDRVAMGRVIPPGKSVFRTVLAHRDGVLLELRAEGDLRTPTNAQARLDAAFALIIGDG